MSFRDSEVNATHDERKRLLSVQADSDDCVDVDVQTPKGKTSV